MKNCLSVEQSAELIKRGVSADKASIVCIDFNGTYAYVSGEEVQTIRDCVNGKFYVEESRVFTLADLLAMLPITIGNFLLSISTSSDGTWCVAYELYDNDDDWWSVVRDVQFTHVETELIDALFGLLCELIDHNHVKLD